MGGDRFGDDRAARHTVSHTMELMLVVLSVIWAGVVDRHPRLRVAFLESGRGWIAPWLDRRDFVPIPPFFQMSKSVVNALHAVGIPTQLRPIDRPAFNAAWREKKLRGLFMAVSGNAGNAASRVAAFVDSGLDDLFRQQGRERDPKRRGALLHRIQQLAVERVMFAPIMDMRALMGVGPRVAEHAIHAVPMALFRSWEDVRLAGQ